MAILSGVLKRAINILSYLINPFLNFAKRLSLSNNSVNYHFRVGPFRHIYKFILINSSPLKAAISLVYSKNRWTSRKYISFTIYFIGAAPEETALSSYIKLKNPIFIVFYFKAV